MSSPAQTPAQARWHRRARHALAHSLRVRLVALFLLLALAMAATFLFGMQKAFSTGWRDAARAAADAGTLRFEGLHIDTARRSVTRAGRPVELTGTEYELLLLLARHGGTVFSRDDILNHLRGHEADLYTRAVDIVVSRLRKKLEPLDAIKSLRNAGYALALRREA